MIYFQNRRVIYCNLTPLFKIPMSLILEEVDKVDKLMAPLCSKGKRYISHQFQINGIESSKLDEKELIHRKKLSRESNLVFPCRGILIRGIKPLNTIDKKPLLYSMSYLIPFTCLYDWTHVSDKLLVLKEFICSLGFEKLGRVILQTVESNRELHPHTDKTFYQGTPSREQRIRHLKQYNITKFETFDVNLILTLVLNEGGGLFYDFMKEKKCVKGVLFYLASDIVTHWTRKSSNRRLICRIEGKASLKLLNKIENSNSKNVLCI